MGHAQIYKAKMKGDNPEIDTLQTPTRWDGSLALLEKSRKAFTDSIPNKTVFGGPVIGNLLKTQSTFFIQI